ncbi:MAG: hypothetical protein IKV94_02235 [Clostridia bacterium]|nr:hypothetical protein [Clostridia bacterium]
MKKDNKIFGNKISNSYFLDARFSKERFILKYGDDTKQVYHLKAVPNPILNKHIGVMNLERSYKKLTLEDNAVIVGNIRMGFGHYRISMAIASCAYALGYTPYWLDLVSFKDTTGSKVISYLNDLYSLGSRLSQKSALFDKLFWEPGSKNAYKKLGSNVIDEKNSELMIRAYQDLDKTLPFIATHSWPAQAAVHAGMKCVVNAVPDNYPMALHLAEGSVHTVQTPSSYLGYKTLQDMSDGKIQPMKESEIVLAGHYVDHEIVSNIQLDCKRRIKRINQDKPLRFLIPVGGAGAGLEMIEKILIHLMPLIEQKKVCIFLNIGDHKDILNSITKEIPNFKKIANFHADNFKVTEAFCTRAGYDENLSGIHVFYHKDIFAAVYSTNILMRECDVMITKPSELAFYPVPKLLIRRVGAHEAYGALRASEIGDGTIECRTFNQTIQMLDMLINEKSNITAMCNNIIKADKAHIYDGGYVAVKTAIKLSKKAKGHK